MEPLQSNVGNRPNSELRSVWRGIRKVTKLASLVFDGRRVVAAITNAVEIQGADVGTPSLVLGSILVLIRVPTKELEAIAVVVFRVPGLFFEIPEAINTLNGF
jgi:hypothetical protein